MRLLTKRTLAAELLALGFNLQATFEFEQLPSTLHREMIRREPESAGFRYLILLGNGGSVFWRHLKQADARQDKEQHPVDVYTRRMVESSFGDDARIVYPGNHLLPLQLLGKLAGWHHDSPLGLGIHPVFGLWFAYRAVILSHAEFTPAAVETEDPMESPCDSCGDKPCIAACPALAASESGFEVQPCSDYRLQIDSPCQSRCISRLACPVARAHRYAPDQMTYHYDFSLEAIKRYRGS